MNHSTPAKAPRRPLERFSAAVPVHPTRNPAPAQLRFSQAGDWLTALREAMAAGRCFVLFNEHGTRLHWD
jgi:hypothetical protein